MTWPVEPARADCKKVGWPLALSRRKSMLAGASFAPALQRGFSSRRGSRRGPNACMTNGRRNNLLLGIVYLLLSHHIARTWYLIARRAWSRHQSRTKTPRTRTPTRAPSRRCSSQLDILKVRTGRECGHAKQSGKSGCQIKTAVTIRT